MNSAAAGANPTASSKVPAIAEQKAMGVEETMLDMDRSRPCMSEGVLAKENPLSSELTVATGSPISSMHRMMVGYE